MNTAGDITGEMDTATFELFRSACTVLFTNIPPTTGRCVNNRVFDKHKRSLVQQTYFIKRDVDGEEMGFTLNLYPTNNKMLLNGKDIDQFMEVYLPEIHQIMLQSLQESGLGSVAEYNYLLAVQLQGVLGNRQSMSLQIFASDHTEDNQILLSTHIVSQTGNRSLNTSYRFSSGS